MEGISDGMAVDDCFYCALLYPNLSDCLRCGKRFKYRPARMRSSARLEDVLDDVIADFQESPGPRSATALLELWHELGEEAERFAIDSRVAIEQLRAHFDAPNAGAFTQCDEEEPSHS